MDEESLQFHIQADDCLGTLATVVDQVSQSLKKRGASSEIAALVGVRDELMHLQQAYTLEKAKAKKIADHKLRLPDRDKGRK